jgi:hypothetical protein
LVAIRRKIGSDSPKRTMTSEIGSDSPKRTMTSDLTASRALANRV